MEKTQKTTTAKILSVLGIVAIVILSLILILNLVIMIKGIANPDVPPSIFGSTPLVVLSGSMSGENEDSFNEGALIFVKKVDAESLKKGDVIAFYDPKSTKNSITTHRIVDVTEVNGETAFYTKGDANNTQDDVPVPASKVIGVHTSHMEGIGNFAMFLQEPIGMLLFIGVPVLSFIVYDMVRRQLAAKTKNQQTQELEAEIERLRALANQSTPPTANNTADNENQNDA